VSPTWQAGVLPLHQSRSERLERIELSSSAWKAEVMCRYTTVACVLTDGYAPPFSAYQTEVITSIRRERYFARVVRIELTQSVLETNSPTLEHSHAFVWVSLSHQDSNLDNPFEYTPD